MVKKVMADMTMAATGAGTIWISVKDLLPWVLSAALAITLIVLQLKRIKESKATTEAQKAEGEYYRLRNKQLKDEIEAKEHEED